MTCDHTNYSEQSIRIVVPKAQRFEQRFMQCQNCDHTFATDSQRKRNRKRYHYASNVYDRMQRMDV